MWQSLQYLYKYHLLLFDLKLGFSRILDSRHVLAVFVHSIITLPKVNRFGWNLEHCWGLALADFGRDLRSSDSWRARRNFLSGKQRTISPISCQPDFTNLKTRRLVLLWKLSEQNLENFTVRGRFKKILKNFYHLVTSGRHNSAMITDHRKSTTKITVYGISSFHFYRWNQFKVITLACTLHTRNFLKFSRTSNAGWHTADNGDITQSHAANHRRLLSHMILVVEWLSRKIFHFVEKLWNLAHL